MVVIVLFLYAIIVAGGCQEKFQPVNSMLQTLNRRIMFMIYSTGIDIIEIERIKAALDRFGQQFIKRVFTNAEIEYCRNRKNSSGHFAARFAAKEAVFKSLNASFATGIRWREIEIMHNDRGAPVARLHGKLLDEKQRHGIEKIEISITHSSTFAAAVAIAVAGE